MPNPTLSLAAFALSVLATPVLADCRDDLIGKFNEVKTAGPHRVEILIHKAAGVETTITDMVPGVGLRMVTNQLGSPMTLIIIGERGWMSAGVGYDLLDAKTAKLFADIANTDQVLTSSDMENVTCAGDGTFSFDIPGLPDPVQVQTDPATGLIARLTSVLQGEPIEVTYTFDPAITVSAPN